MEAETTQSSETYYKALAWLHANRQRILIGIGIILVLGLIAGIVAWNKQEKDADANARLFDIPLTSAPGMPATAASPNVYLDIARDYPNTSAGEHAVLLGGESLFVEGKYPEAEHEFAKFIDEHPDSGLVPQAKVGVAASLEAEGKTSDAIQKYQDIVSSYASELSVVSPAKLTLARLYEQQNRPDQALALYADLARSQNPNDPWGTEARERAQLLLANHPELRKAQQPPPSNAPFSISQPVPPPAAVPATAPAPQNAGQNPPINLLSIPSASSNATKKP